MKKKSTMTLEHDGLRLEQMDELNWMLMEWRVPAPKKDKPQRPGAWAVCSYHGDIEHALRAACRRAADQKAETWKDYLAEIERTWNALTTNTNNRAT